MVGGAAISNELAGIFLPRHPVFGAEGAQSSDAKCQVIPDLEPGAVEPQRKQMRLLTGYV